MSACCRYRVLPGAVQEAGVLCLYVFLGVAHLTHSVLARL